VDGSNFCAHSETYAFLGEACLGQGKLKEALDATNRALALARESENDLDLGIAWRTLGKVLTAWNKDELGAPGVASICQPQPEPQSCFLKSHQIFKKINAESEAARTLREWAQFEIQNGRVEEGTRMLEEAQMVLSRLGALGAGETEPVAKSK
jgi:tetratricopeptide (TPR) repeat protein